MYEKLKIFILICIYVIFILINLFKDRQFNKKLNDAFVNKEHDKSIQLLDDFLKNESRHWKIVLLRIQFAFLHQDKEIFDKLVEKYKNVIFKKSNQLVILSVKFMNIILLLMDGRSDDAEQIFLDNESLFNLYEYTLLDDITIEYLYKTYKIIQLYNAGSLDEALVESNNLPETEEGITSIYIRYYRCKIFADLYKKDELKNEINMFSSMPKDIPYMKEIEKLKGLF